jgi:parvulin-like peptidyl-prolyl isomerase
VQEFQATAFSAGVNSLSAPVKTEYGYHLILVSEDRASEQYSDIDPGSDNYNDFIQQTARTCVSSKLQPAAQEYDIQTIKEYGVVFDTEQLRNIYSEIEKTLKKNKITGNPNVDIVSVLNNMENISTVCVINNKGFGVKWFASKFGRLPMSRRPRINSLESLESVFTITILQEVAIERASLSKLDQDPLFESMFDGYETSILFEAFKKYVDNSLVEADSAMIADYYHENKDIEFSEGEKVSLREIRVSTQSLSDSLYSFINNEDDFIEIARQFSLINPEDGGKKQPFARGKFATLGDKAFTLDVGEISRPFENLDRSWSIIMLIEKIPNGYKPLEKVKNKIVTILNRENKASKKDELFEELKIKYGVVIEDGFFQFESSEEPDPAG